MTPTAYIGLVGTQVTLFSNPADGKGVKDSVVSCAACGRRYQVNFAACIALGWPKCYCNDRTMTLIHTDADIDAAVANIIRVSRSLRRA